MAPLGPLGRIVMQVVVPLVAVIARALPAAYAQAVQNARKGGASKSASVFNKQRMSHTEALQILNLDKSQITDVKAIQKQYEKYFAANAVNKGGSFYLQSKVYRAKEMLDEYIREQQQEQNSSSNGEESAKQRSDDEKKSS